MLADFTCASPRVRKMTRRSGREKIARMTCDRIGASLEERSQNYVKKGPLNTHTRGILSPQLSFPSLFEDTINNRPFRSQKDVIESRFLSAPTFEAVL